MDKRGPENQITSRNLPGSPARSPQGLGKLTSALGCWFILRTGLMMIFLLLINGMLVRAFLSANDELANELRIAQTLQFVLPVGLIFVEYWVFDFFRGMGHHR